MKRGRRLTRDEKSCLLAQGIDYKQYMFSENVNDSYFKVVHKETGIQKIVDRYKKSKNKYDY